MTALSICGMMDTVFERRVSHYGIDKWRSAFNFTVVRCEIESRNTADKKWNANLEKRNTICKNRTVLFSIFNLPPYFHPLPYKSCPLSCHIGHYGWLPTEACRTSSHPAPESDSPLSCRPDCCQAHPVRCTYNHLTTVLPNRFSASPPATDFPALSWPLYRQAANSAVYGLFRIPVQGYPAHREHFPSPFRQK